MSNGLQGFFLDPPCKINCVVRFTRWQADRRRCCRNTTRGCRRDECTEAVVRVDGAGLPRGRVPVRRDHMAGQVQHAGLHVQGARAHRRLRPADRAEGPRVRRSSDDVALPASAAEGELQDGATSLSYQDRPAAGLRCRRYRSRRRSRYW